MALLCEPTLKILNPFEWIPPAGSEGKVLLFSYYEVQRYDAFCQHEARYFLSPSPPGDGTGGEVERKVSAEQSAPRAKKADS